MTNKPMIINTKRLSLHQMNNNDELMMIKILTNEEIKKTYMIPDFNTIDEVSRLFHKIKEVSENGERFTYGIYLDDGLIGFINDVEIMNGEIELGYVIYPDYKNNGYATEVLIKAIDVLLEIGYEVVKTAVFSDNIPSLKVMEKAGMTKLNEITDIEYKGKTYSCIWYEIRK